MMEAGSSVGGGWKIWALEDARAHYIFRGLLDLDHWNLTTLELLDRDLPNSSRHFICDITTNMR